MEDQQPAAGDLSDQPGSDESTDDAGVEDGADQAAPVLAPSAEGGTETAAAGGPLGKRLVVAVVAAAVLFVGSAAFAGAAVQPLVVDRATVNIKLDVARTAANAITTLWTYTPDNIETLAHRAATYLSGDFEAQYSKFVDAIAATNKQAQVTNTTHVTGAGVESLDGPDAVALVYTNTTSTSPLTKNIPSLRYLSYRVVMRRDHARWLVTRMVPITSLDLTPRL